VPEILQFEREDWVLFRTVEGLTQRSGVQHERLCRLVMKELADNALDESVDVRVGVLLGGGWVEDNGRGIDPDMVPMLFSIARPMRSSKLLRLPTRGALGNGLRVVASAVLVSGGSLVVTTRDRRITLRPERDGSTTVVRRERAKHPTGTRVEFTLGPALPLRDHAPLAWAHTACTMARLGEKNYTGASSPWWYDPIQFHELLTASGKAPVRELVSRLSGCTGATAGKIVTEAKLTRALGKDITADQARRLLMIARAQSRPVNPERLGYVGPLLDLTAAYARTTGTTVFGSTEPLAEVPFVVEAWATPTKMSTTVEVCVNRTPATADINADRNGRDIDFFGCGLADTIAEGPKDKHFHIRLNVITPYMPITSDGKAPDLDPFLDEITTVVAKVVRKTSGGSTNRSTARKTQKDVVLNHLDEAVGKAGGGLQFNQRQLLYVLRPIVMTETGQVLTEGNFGKIITEYENEHGEIPLMYREPRGSIYHPHIGETLPLGTLMVKDYERPAWTFNKVLYIEKEGFSEAVKELRWAERHDIALMSSKGFTTRAAKDLVDKLAEHDEPVTVFCAHDADAAGTMIHQTFQQATKARGARKITIANLGLEPWEAIAMGLEVETFERGKTRRAVASYVHERTDRDWEEWLQTHRIELNAMTTPQFIAWLDGKLAPYEGKLIPPDEVLLADFDAKVESTIRDQVMERILREAQFEEQVADALAAIDRPTADILAQAIRQGFERDPDSHWRNHIVAVNE
jgi:hypothetical protein